MWGNSCSSSKRVHEMESLSVEIWCDGKHSQFPVVRERPTPPINYHATKKRRKKKAAPPPLDEFPSRPFFKKRDGQNNENGVPLENKKKKKIVEIFSAVRHTAPKLRTLLAGGENQLGKFALGGLVSYIAGTYV